MLSPCCRAVSVCVPVSVFFILCRIYHIRIYNAVSVLRKRKRSRFRSRSRPDSRSSQKALFLCLRNFKKRSRIKSLHLTSQEIPKFHQIIKLLRISSCKSKRSPHKYPESSRENDKEVRQRSLYIHA